MATADPPGTAPGPPADYFDRLVGRGGPARVRPRLPEPFERADAPHGPAEPLELDEERPAAAPPRPARPAAGPAPLHTAPARAADPAPARPAPPRVTRVLRETAVLAAAPAPLLLPPAAPPPPVPPPARPARERAAEPTDRQEPALAPVLPPTTTERPAPGPAPARPAVRATVPVPDARGTARERDRRRPAAERTVHVTIGRVEVTAAAPPRRGPAPDRPRRPAPTVSLDTYLSRGGEGA
jgi:hypothetical protein